jgi:DNA recombination-dependent growth factor C
MNKIITLLLLVSGSAYGMEKGLTNLQLKYIQTYKQKCADVGYNFDDYCELKMKKHLVTPGVEAKKTFYDEITQHMQIPKDNNDLAFVFQETISTFTADEYAEIFKNRS